VNDETCAWQISGKPNLSGKFKTETGLLQASRKTADSQDSHDVQYLMPIELISTMLTIDKDLWYLIESL